MRRFAFAALAAALTACLAPAALAAPTLEGVSLGEYACGPKVTAPDLRGRVVVFEYWGQHCPPCLASIPHLAQLQAKYPYQALIVVANHCQDGDAKNAAKVWAERQGGNKVAVINQGDLKGAQVSKIPRVFVFSALGRCVFDGNPHDEKFTAAVADAVKSSPGAAAVQRIMAAQAEAKNMFGDQIPDELMKIALQATDTSRSSEPPLRILEAAAKSKNAKLAGDAKNMLAAFDKYVARKFEDAKKLADESAAEAWAQMELLARWVPQKEEGLKAQKQKAEWRRDGMFLKEMVADKAWLALKAQADKIGFEKNPRIKPTNQLESDYKKLLADKDCAGTKGLAKAKAAAEGWKLDPETGRADKFKPGARQEKPKDAAATPEQQ